MWNFLKWSLKLITPDFLIGHPNLLDNLRTLYKHQNFKPLRLAVAAWMIFALSVGSSGIYLLASAPEADAANDFSIKTGSYLGSGISRSITGLGFTPEIVIIKADTAAGQLVWKSSAMPGAVSTYLGAATADNTETEIILDQDGFTVSAALEVNTVNVNYTFIAFAGSDCTSGGVMCVGLYTGDGAASKAINTGFKPDLVWVKRTTAVAGNFRTSAMNDNQAALFSAAALDTTGVYFKTLDDGGGFTVGLTNNTNGGVFYYVAFKTLPNKFYTNKFTGNGVDDRNITGVGFEPDFVLVKQDSANAAVFNTTEMYGDYSSYVTATASIVNLIQSLDNDGFQVGNNAAVNANGIVSHYFAFGGSPDPSPSGTFFMQRGSYTGTGVAQSIDTTFAPNLVIIKGNTAQYAVWSTSLEGDATEYFSLAGAAFVGGITGMSNTGFNLGTHATVNTNGVTYEWTAYGNATTPRQGDGAEDFYIGSYTGNAIDGRAIDHLGFAPDLVVVKRSVGTANQSFWKASSPYMADNTTAHFSATADVTNGSIFKSLTSDGFTMGNNAGINAVGGTYNWFAFKNGPSFQVGYYSGNGTDDRSISGTSFTPDFAWTKRDTAIAAVHRSSNSSLAEGTSQHFMNLSNDTNDIKSFTSTGFVVGTSAEVNTTGTANNYRFAAWKGSTSANAPNTPTSSSPSDAATSQNLNVTLSGSTYSDPESNAHLYTQWQVDNDSNFSSPVWTRSSGSAEVSTSVTSGNGTFAEELSGKTELDHNSTYYWRVRYSDGVWSSWSTPTSFTTNIISTPTHSSPANEATVTSLTPTLSASAFSDAQGGHSAESAQWQINTNNSFSNPLYDSGVVSYGASFAVSSSVLSDNTVYFWRVKHKDSSGIWSEYSTPTKFLVKNSQVTVSPLFGTTIVDQNDSINIDAQIKLADGTIINNATVTINIYNPSGTKVVSAATMDYLAGSNGVYRKNYTIPATSGSYLYEVTAVSNGVTGYGAANFEVRTIASDINSTKSTVESEQTSQASERSAQSTERTQQSESRDKIDDIQTKVTSVQSNLDILIGAMIVTQGTVNDGSPSTSLFTTSLTNSVSNFYKNAVLTFTSGSLDGQSRRISNYDGSTKRITLDPVLTSAPSNGDSFTIVSQNVRVEEQLGDHESAQGAFRADVVSRLTDIEGKVDSITSTLNTVNTNLDSISTIVNNIRTSQQKNYRATLSDVSDIQAGGTYRAKLVLQDFESNPVDASTLPTITIYDSTRAEAQVSTSMTKLSTGVYEYTTIISSSATAGLWESVVNIDVAGSADIIRNDYWRVTGAPAQVVINSMSDVTIPSIAANVTITNEGSSPFEYQYEWCVVSTQANQCGGGDDVYYASAAKLIAAGEDFNPTLTATVPNTGSYWFKTVVYFGSENSGASRFFEAVSPDQENVPPPSSNSGGGGGGTRASATSENIYSEILNARNQLEMQSVKLSKALEILGVLSPNMQKLLQISEVNSGNILEMQNKISELRAVSTATKRIIEQNGIEPIVETFMTFNSVELNFLITNPDTLSQTVKFRAFLPEEVKPEHIMDLNGLSVDYDTNAKVYYVHGNVSLGPRETITRKIEMKDIWVIEQEQINSIREQLANLLPILSRTHYDAQGAILKNDIESTLNIILLKQEDSYSSPQEHIVVYRENVERMMRVTNNLEKLKDLVVQAGVTRGVVGQVGGIQTFATWGIILVLIFGFGLLAAIIFSMWKHQTMLGAMAMGMDKDEALARFGGGGFNKVVTSGSGPGNIRPLYPSFSFPWMKICKWFVLIVVPATTIFFLIRYASSILGSKKESYEYGVSVEEPVKNTNVKTERNKSLESDNNTKSIIGNDYSEGRTGLVGIQPASETTSASRIIKITETPTGWLNVRSSANVESFIISKVYPGFQFEYTEEMNGWYKIILEDGNEGWVNGSYVNKVNEKSTEADGVNSGDIQPVLQTTSASRIIKITETPTGWLNVRSSANAEGFIISKVYPGFQFEYTEELGGWYKIILQDKREGWVSGSYVNKINE